MRKFGSLDIYCFVILDIIVVFLTWQFSIAVVKMTCLNDVHTVHKSIVKEAIK